MESQNAYSKPLPKRPVYKKPLPIDPVSPRGSSAQSPRNPRGKSPNRPLPKVPANSPPQNSNTEQKLGDNDEVQVKKDVEETREEKDGRLHITTTTTEVTTVRRESGVEELNTKKKWKTKIMPIGSTGWDSEEDDSKYSRAGLDHPLSEAEEAVLKALNDVRTEPKSYIPKVKERLQHFDDRIYRDPDGTIELMTTEGISAVEECIEHLETQESVPALTVSKGLCCSARSHAFDVGPKGMSDHKGSDGSSSAKRMNRYGKWRHKAAENVDVGKKSGEDVVISLIIDDGILARGHRSNIFETSFTKVGISIAPHSVYDEFCVMDFAQEYTEK